MAYYQIVQSPTHVVLFMEVGHEARVIPIDGSAHLSPTLRQWNGDSRGHWEGNTLVVDTTNFSPNSYFMGSTERLHVIERFTRCLLYTSDAADERSSVDLGGRRII